MRIQIFSGEVSPIDLVEDSEVRGEPQRGYLQEIVVYFNYFFECRRNRYREHSLLTYTVLTRHNLYHNKLDYKITQPLLINEPFIFI